MNQMEREILILEENFRDTIENDIAKKTGELITILPGKI